MHKIEKIIEVYKVLCFSTEEQPLRKTGFFQVSKETFNDIGEELFNKWNIKISKVLTDSLILEMSANEEEIQELYNYLKENFLIAFCKSALVNPNALVYLNKLKSGIKAVG